MKAVLLLIVLLLTIASPALAATPMAADRPLLLATEAENEGEEAPSTTSVSNGGIEPAELAPPVGDEESEEQWTAKFLAPTVAILGALGVIAALAMYGLRLRARYRVVD